MWSVHVGVVMIAYNQNVIVKVILHFLYIGVSMLKVFLPIVEVL
jgi:hypothetical protein